MCDPPPQKKPQNRNQPGTVILRGSASPHGHQAFLQTKCILTKQQSVLLLISIGTAMINKTNILKTRTNAQWLFWHFLD